MRAMHDLPPPRAAWCGAAAAQGGLPALPARSPSLAISPRLVREEFQPRAEANLPAVRLKTVQAETQAGFSGEKGLCLDFGIRGFFRQPPWTFHARRTAE